MEDDYGDEMEGQMDEIDEMEGHEDDEMM